VGRRNRTHQRAAVWRAALVLRASTELLAAVSWWARALLVARVLQGSTTKIVALLHSVTSTQARAQAARVAQVASFEVAAQVFRLGVVGPVQVAPLGSTEAVVVGSTAGAVQAARPVPLDNTTTGVQGSVRVRVTLVELAQPVSTALVALELALGAAQLVLPVPPASTARVVRI
jgi:hypothetical protein